MPSKQVLLPSKRKVRGGAGGGRWGGGAGRAGGRGRRGAEGLSPGRGCFQPPAPAAAAGAPAPPPPPVARLGRQRCSLLPGPELGSAPEAPAERRSQHGQRPVIRTPHHPPPLTPAPPATPAIPHTSHLLAGRPRRRQHEGRADRQAHALPQPGAGRQAGGLVRAAHPQGLGPARHLRQRAGAQQGYTGGRSGCEARIAGPGRVPGTWHPAPGNHCLPHPQPVSRSAPPLPQTSRTIFNDSDPRYDDKFDFPMVRVPPPRRPTGPPRGGHGEPATRPASLASQVARRSRPAARAPGSPSPPTPPRRQSLHRLACFQALAAAPCKRAAGRRVR
jgi:hypothetical protein